MSLRLARTVVLAALFALAPACGPAREGPATGEVRIAAAADLKSALDALFRESAVPLAGVHPVVVYGSSGSFFAQIENGAPYDLFLSADADYPRRLAAKGLTDGPAFLYAVGRIAVWVPTSSRLDVRALGLKALLDPSVRTIAIANPRHAPYGRAAEAAMRTLGVHDDVKSKLVLGENVAQAAQFARSGAADAGVIALSLAISPEMRSAGRFGEVPIETYPRLEQGGIVLMGARDPAAARTVRDVLLGAPGRAVLARQGFTLPAP